MSLYVIRLRDNRDNDCIAYKSPDDEEWKDPYGGRFTESELAALDEVASGKRASVTLDANSRWERTHTLHVTAHVVERRGEG